MNQGPSIKPNLERFLNWLDTGPRYMGPNVSPIVQLEQLRLLPRGTLGRTWADFLDRHKIAPMGSGPRRKQLHDGLHVLNGYGTSMVDEARLQAFVLGCKFHPINLALLVWLLRACFRRNGKLPWQLLRQAYWRGRCSGFDPNTWHPEFQWSLPLTQVQSLLGIQTPQGCHHGIAEEDALALKGR